MMNYKGLHATLERLIVSDAQVDRQIGQLLDQNPRIIQVTDRPSQLDDELVLDYAGYADGVQFEGGTAERQTLTLGSGTFIPGFEEQLIGHRVGDEVDVRVTFPTQYHAPNLAGKEALFKCRIHEIRVKRRYDVDDTFAREVAGLGSFDALRQRMREGLQAYADRQAEEELQARLLDMAMEGYACEITDAQIDAAVDQQIQSLEAQLQRQGLTLDAYCQFTGKSREQLRSDARPDAVKAIRRQRAIVEIADAEHIEADEQSVSEALQIICQQNHLTLDQLKGVLDEKAQSAVIRNVITAKTLQFIRDSAVIETHTAPSLDGSDERA